MAEIPDEHLNTLVAVAKLYIASFGEDELMSLTEKLAFQDVEAAVEWADGREGLNE